MFRSTIFQRPLGYIVCTYTFPITLFRRRERHVDARRARAISRSVLPFSRSLFLKRQFAADGEALTYVTELRLSA